jgi:hypothetical protein
MPTTLTLERPLSANPLSPQACVPHDVWSFGNSRKADECQGSGILTIASPMSHQARATFRIGSAGIQPIKVHYTTTCIALKLLFRPKVAEIRCVMLAQSGPVAWVNVGRWEQSHIDVL